MKKGITQAWLEAQKRDQERRDRLHAEKACSEFAKDLAWTRHVNDALTVLEGGADDGA